MSVSGCTTREWDKSDRFKYEQRYKEREVQDKNREKRYLNDISKSKF